MTISPNSPSEGKIYYIKKSFRNKKGKCTSKNVRRLGTLAEIREREGVADAWAWAKAECERETMLENESRRSVVVRFDPNKILDKGQRRSFNLGYLICQLPRFSCGISHSLAMSGHWVTFSQISSTILSGICLVYHSDSSS